MAEQNYAFIKDNNVINIGVFDNPTQELLDIFIDQYNADSCIPGNENAEVGGTYDGYKFWKKKPSESWIKDEETNQWVPPVPIPSNGKRYIWNENIQQWQEIMPE